MPKPSAFMVRLQENQRHNMHLQRLFTILRVVKDGDADA